MSLIWECQQCSFHNHTDLNICEICEGVRDTTRVPVSTLQSSSSTSRSAQLPTSLSADVMKMLQVSLKKSSTSFQLCSPPCLHFSQRGSYGSQWSCGYRNIQIMCSSLVQIPILRSSIFVGDGVVPNIAGVQRWIEAAWRDGFDVEVSR